MTDSDTPPKIHEGRNIKRFREMLGMKQEALASELGDTWTQKKVSLIESKETVEPDILEEIAKILQIAPDAIKNFSEESAINYFNTFNDSSTGAFQNYHCTFNPIEKIIQLYDEKIQLYERMLKEKNQMLEKLSKIDKLNQ